MEDWIDLEPETISTTLDAQSIFDIGCALMDLLNACTKFSLSPTRYPQIISDKENGAPFRIVIRIILSALNKYSYNHEFYFRHGD